MAEPPRAKEARILPRPLLLWLAFVGLVFAAVTLPLIAWAGTAFDVVVSHTMGLVTFSLLHLWFSLETSNEERSLFSSELLDNPTLLKASLASAVSIFLATTFGPLQRLLDTTELSLQQWAICLALSTTVIWVAEVRKFFRRRRSSQAEREADARPRLVRQPS